MKRCQLGAHVKHDLKVQLVGIPKYRKSVLTGEATIRVRKLICQTTMEDEIAMHSGKVARDHIDAPAAYTLHVNVGVRVQRLGNPLSNTPSGVRTSVQAVLGTSFLGQG